MPRKLKHKLFRWYLYNTGLKLAFTFTPMRFSSFSRTDVSWAVFNSAELGWIKASATSWMFNWAGSGSCMHSAKWKRAWCFQTVWSHATRCALFRRHTHTHTQILIHKMLFHCISHTTDHGAQAQASRRKTKAARSCSKRWQRQKCKTCNAYKAGEPYLETCPVQRQRGKTIPCSRSWQHAEDAAWSYSMKQAAAASRRGVQCVHEYIYIKCGVHMQVAAFPA